MSKRILSVVGARPQFIKAFPVSNALRRSHDDVLVHTGQHYDAMLSDVFFAELDIPEPAYNLGVGSGTHADQTAQMMIELDDVLDAESPDVMIVYGDTNSTLAGALVAAKRSTTLVHIEAGLRSGNRSMPEEHNRIATDHLADVLLAPTSSAVDTLRSESVPGEIHETGDVMYDAILYVRERANEVSAIREQLDLEPDGYVLATVHRAGNTSNKSRLSSIIRGLASVSVPVVLPIHPRTEAALKENGLWQLACDQLTIIDPVGYLDFVSLLEGATLVATDSGGVQREAFYLDTQCITLRDETEWVETIDCGWNTLVGADSDRIAQALAQNEPNPPKPQLYGDGRAAERVAEVIDSV
ncbi:non-hydrolyzing UDP-N-acetylglucosamine 2-epimerase [Halocatena marina]|uniref:non-hydrolyzing UDP-N-acetylglucosamine 2-epimerase n=1 Tax=Halocatena marina TaxID=2934937 RepID=UPI0020104116|nr:UDP-N-acetylglucosamine 2-epimerase (non-hydrolyzing) [Halocatena marina]